MLIDHSPVCMTVITRAVVVYPLSFNTLIVCFIIFLLTRDDF